MTIWLDTKYINEISSQLLLFKKKNGNLWTFRCPFCGDSQKNKRKTRGYLYTKNHTISYRCHNCGIGKSLSNFFKELDHPLFKRYQMEMFMNGNDRQSANPCPKMSESQLKADTKTSTKSRLGTSKLIGIESVASLPDEHPARVYLHDRCIVDADILKDLYYTPNFRTYTTKHYPHYANVGTEHRIIIPFRSQDNKVLAVQGRLIDSTPGALRYITLKDTDVIKVYGLDKVDTCEHVRVCEGAFDSFFVDNCIAMGGADIDGINEVLPTVDNSKLIFIFDNEPRNVEIVKRMEKIIKRGFSIVIWPSTFIYNDINDSIIKGWTKDDVNAIINSNTYNGMNAKIKMSEWKRI